MARSVRKLRAGGSIQAAVLCVKADLE